MGDLTLPEPRCVSVVKIGFVKLALCRDRDFAIGREGLSTAGQVRIRSHDQVLFPVAADCATRPNSLAGRGAVAFDNSRMLPGFAAPLDAAGAVRRYGNR